MGWEDQLTTNTAVGGVHTTSSSSSSSSSHSSILPMILDPAYTGEDTSMIPNGDVITDKAYQQATVDDDAPSAVVEVPRDLKALKRRRQSAIPMFAARGGSSNNASNSMNTTNPSGYPCHIVTTSSGSGACNDINCPTINSSSGDCNHSTSLLEDTAEETCAMVIVNPTDTDELPTVPTDHPQQQQLQQQLQPLDLPSTSEETSTSEQPFTSVVVVEIEQAVSHENETLLAPFAMIEFDLGSSSNNNTGIHRSTLIPTSLLPRITSSSFSCLTSSYLPTHTTSLLLLTITHTSITNTSHPYTPPRLGLKSGSSRGNRGRPSIAVSSRLASNRYTPSHDIPSHDAPSHGIPTHDIPSHSISSYGIPSYEHDIPPPLPPHHYIPPNIPITTHLLVAFFS